jgi:hypothetical protein
MDNVEAIELGCGCLVGAGRHTRRSMLIRVTAVAPQEKPRKVLVGVRHIIEVRPSRDGGSIILLPELHDRDLDSRLCVQESVDEIEALVLAAVGGRPRSASRNGSTGAAETRAAS